MHGFKASRSARAFQLGRVHSTIVGALLCAAIVTIPFTLLSSTVEAAPAAQAAYVPVQPCRLADTRLASGYSQASMRSRCRSRRAGVCGIPSNATSLALTLTVDRPQSSGYPHSVARRSNTSDRVERQLQCRPGSGEQLDHTSRFLWPRSASSRRSHRR